MCDVLNCLTNITSPASELNLGERVHDWQRLPNTNTTSTCYIIHQATPGPLSIYLQ